LFRGLYAATTGMVTQQIKQEGISNNLVNANTPGYKRDDTVLKAFPEVMLAEVGKGHADKIGTITQGALVDERVTIQQPGALEETGRNLDLAIVGNGYFTVDTPSGLRYTKNGHFQLNNDGYLVTEEGYDVLGEDGRIKLDSKEFAVDDQGNLMIDGNQEARLRVTTFHNPNSLLKEKDVLFRPTEATIIDDDVRYLVRQKMLEKSNVNLVKEMVNLMSGIRAFESNQRIIQAYDQMLGKSASEIGRID